MMVWLDCCLWADRSTVLVNPDALTWLLSMGCQINCPIHCPGCMVIIVWFDLSMGCRSTVQSTVLVGPDGLTWLLSMDWQIHCSGWFWMVWLDCSLWTDRSLVQVGSGWSDLTALYGLTDPLFRLVLDGLTWPLSMDWQIHCSGWFWMVTWLLWIGLWVDISAAHGCWRLELYSTQITFHDSTVGLK